MHCARNKTNGRQTLRLIKLDTDGQLWYFHAYAVTTDRYGLVTGFTEHLFTVHYCTHTSVRSNGLPQPSGNRFQWWTHPFLWVPKPSLCLSHGNNGGHIPSSGFPNRPCASATATMGDYTPSSGFPNRPCASATATMADTPLPLGSQTVPVPQPWQLLTN
jgi:hypothetical protein